MTSVDWNDLSFFLVVARTGRLTSASRRLSVDHATVSRRIHALELALNTRLFERSPRGYSLTEAGERLLVHAEQIENAMERMQSDIAGENVTLRGVVRIGAPDGFGSHFLAPRLGQLCHRFPELDLQIVVLPRIFNVSKREADIAIALARPTEGRLIARKLTDYQLGLYATRAYLASHDPIERTADLASHLLIGYIRDLIFAPELDYLPQVSPLASARLSSSSLVAQLQAARSDAGVCVLPYFMAAVDPTLVRVLPSQIELVRSFWLIMHSDLRAAHRVRAVADFVVEQVNACRAEFLPRPP